MPRPRCCRPSGPFESPTRDKQSARSLAPQTTKPAFAGFCVCGGGGVRLVAIQGRPEVSKRPPFLIGETPPHVLTSPGPSNTIRKLNVGKDVGSGAEVAAALTRRSRQEARSGLLPRPRPPVPASLPGTHPKLDLPFHLARPIARDGARQLERRGLGRRAQEGQ